MFFSKNSTQCIQSNSIFYREARNHVTKFMKNAVVVAMLASTFTSAETHPRANRFRTLLKIRMVRYIQAVVSICKSRRYVMEVITRFDPKDAPEDPCKLAQSIHELICNNGDYIDGKMHITQEMRIHQYLQDSTQAYYRMTQFSTTPSPWPIANMLQLMLLFFNITVPLVILSTFENQKDGNIFQVIIPTVLIAYVYNTVEAIATQINDPFGCGVNNLELKLLAGSDVATIFRWLRPRDEADLLALENYDDANDFEYLERNVEKKGNNRQNRENVEKEANGQESFLFRSSRSPY